MDRDVDRDVEQGMEQGMERDMKLDTKQDTTRVWKLDVGSWTPNEIPKSVSVHPRTSATPTTTPPSQKQFEHPQCTERPSPWYRMLKHLKHTVNPSIKFTVNLLIWTART
jgi:hypothetical protein